MTQFLIIAIALILLIVPIGPIRSCQLGNKQLQACVHTYLERDFSIVEQLIRHAAPDETGRVLIEEIELEQMCDRFADMTRCYESIMTRGCTAYSGYSALKRIIRGLRAVETSLCSAAGNDTRGIKDLILGGYCIEYARKQSACTGYPDDPPSTRTPANPVTAHLLPELHRFPAQWPYTLAGMLRLEVGVSACGYLRQFAACLEPHLHMSCHESSLAVWNRSFTAIMNSWCGNGGAARGAESGILWIVLTGLLWILAWS